MKKLLETMNFNTYVVTSLWTFNHLTFDVRCGINDCHISWKMFYVPWNFLSFRSMHFCTFFILLTHLTKWRLGSYAFCIYPAIFIPFTNIAHFRTFILSLTSEKSVSLKLKRASKKDFHYACIIEWPTELELLPTQGPLMMYLS